MKRHEILGTPVDALTYGDAVEKVRASISTREPLWILAVNPEKIMKTLKDRKLKKLLLCADLFIPDGVGILWAGKILCKPFRQRVTGVDLLMTLVAEAAQKNKHLSFRRGTGRGRGCSAKLGKKVIRD